MKYTSYINGKEVVFFCNENLKDIAEFFISILQNEDTAYNIISENKNIQIAWGFYKVLKTNCNYQIVCYDILNNPFNDITEDLSLNLEIMIQQYKILQITKAIAQDTSLQDTMIVQKEAFKASQVYMERCEPQSHNDSGWYMGVINGDESDSPDRYVGIYTYELINFCKNALSVLQLPVGTVCIFENGILIEAVDKDNNKIF